MPLDIRRASGNGRRVQVADISDFNGGLNLETDTFKLAENESPDMLNVDVDRRGGFQLRRGINAFTTSALPFKPQTAIKFMCQNSGATAKEECVVVGYAGEALPGMSSRVILSDGTHCDLLATTLNTRFHRYAVFTDKLYVLRWDDLTAGAAGPYRWDGTWTAYGTNPAETALSSSGPTWQDSYASPSGTYCPRAKCVAAHTGYLWVACTEENGTAYLNRVRWSHPNDGGSWRANDYIDIDIGHDNDVITALVPYGDTLLVFKKRSMHAIMGYDPKSFQVVTLSNTVGTFSQESVVATPEGVFFWDPEQGLMNYTGREPEWVGQKIHQAIRDGLIPEEYKDPTALTNHMIGHIQLGWVESRVWCTVPYGETATELSHTFVFDPFTSAWMLYDLPTGPYVKAFGKHLGGHVSSQHMVDLVGNTAIDDKDGVSTTHIDAHFRTAWIDLDDPARKKRWRRPEFVVTGGVDDYLTVQVYTDYSVADFKKQYQVYLGGANSGGLYGTGLYGTATYGSSTEEFDTISQGAGMGVARALSLVVTGPTSNVDWGVNGFSLKYVPRKVR